MLHLTMEWVEINQTFDLNWVYINVNIFRDFGPFWLSFECLSELRLGTVQGKCTQSSNSLATWIRTTLTMIHHAKSDQSLCNNEQQWRHLIGVINEKEGWDDRDKSVYHASRASMYQHLCPENVWADDQRGFQTVTFFAYFLFVCQVKWEIFFSHVHNYIKKFTGIFKSSWK